MGLSRTITAVVAVAILALPLSAVAAPPPPPLIANGDFENATLTGWIDYNGGALLVGQSGWTAASGKQSVELRGDGLIYQDVPTTAGQRYDLSFAYAGNPTVDSSTIGCEQQGVKTLDVDWNGTLAGHGAGAATLSFDTTGHTTASMGWQTAHLLVDAADASTHLSFADYHDGGCGAAVDNVVMTTPSAGETGVQLTSQRDFTVTGEPLTVTATVLGSSSAVTPTGSVQFTVDGVPAGDPAALNAGQAQLTLNDLPPGSHDISASYSPDSGSFTPSSVTQRFSVMQAPTSVALVVDPSYAAVGSPAMATASVDVFSPGSGTPTGTIQFSDESGPLGDPVVLDADGVAQFPILEDVGDHVIYADYSGDDGYLAAWTDADLTVYDPNASSSPPPSSSKIRTTTTITSSKNPIAPGESYTVTATVAPTTAGGAPLDGTIQFSVAGVAVGDPVPLDANHSAAMTLTAPSTAARQSIVARYSGNAAYALSQRTFFETVLSPQVLPRPAPQPLDLTPATFTVTVARTRLAAALRHGVRVHVACSEACKSGLQLLLSRRAAHALGIRTAHLQLVVGRASDPDSGTPSSDLVVRFSARYRKRLLHARRLALQLQASVVDSAGNRSERAQALVLRR